MCPTVALVPLFLMKHIQVGRAQHDVFAAYGLEEFFAELDAVQVA